MKQLTYRRDDAVAYAKQWAFGRNPKFLNFDGIGGDCTNFASQCIYAGSGIMNHTPTFGWFYYSSTDRTASWTGVQYLYNFLTSNQSVGPYARETDASLVEPGDILQLGNGQGEFYHSPVVVKMTDGEIYVAAHSFDAFEKPLSSYLFSQVRFLHILGVRNW